ncbi:MAG: HNH endonuclease [Chloroflexi bacterium]|nr:HNH endonuclease [Chloroflexota bacterium]
MSKSLLFLIRDFKHHYHKVRPVADTIAKKGDFKLNVKFDGNELRSEYRLPDEEEVMRFVILMRRFLSPSDSLYFQRTWTIFRKEFAQEIPDSTTKLIDKIIEQLSIGQLGINIDGEDLTSEKIYQILSDGVFFNHDENAQKYLRSLKDLPVVGNLFWHQFYTYTLNGFKLIYMLFDVVLHIEKCTKYQTLARDNANKNVQCIYCLTTTGAFISEEHIFPESLGNDELILPKGFVCDKCNHGVLAELDNALLKFEPIAFLQMQFVPYKKDGKLPEANFQNLSMERKSPKNIVIKAKDKTGQPKGKKHLGDGWYSSTVKIKGKKLNPKLLGRVLYKIALGMVAFSEGHSQACSQIYDAAREFIRDGKTFQNNLLMRLEGRPHPTVWVARNDLEGTDFVIDIYGLVFRINLEEKSILVLDDELTKAKFSIYPLYAE